MDAYRLIKTSLTLHLSDSCDHFVYISVLMQNVNHIFEDEIEM